MSSYDYLLLGGSRDGNKHTEEFYKSRLEFITKLDNPSNIGRAKHQTKKIEKYTVYSVSGPDGGFYFIGCCKVTNFPSQSKLNNIFTVKKIRPIS